MKDYRQDREYCYEEHSYIRQKQRNSKGCEAIFRPKDQQYDNGGDNGGSKPTYCKNWPAMATSGVEDRITARTQTQRKIAKVKRTGGGASGDDGPKPAAPPNPFSSVAFGGAPAAAAQIVAPPV